MTSTVKVTAHCGSNKEVTVFLNGAVEQILQDGESKEFCVYGDRYIAVNEVVKSKYLPHQQRVVDEKLTLDGKIGLLGNFTLTTVFSGLDQDEQKRLRDQHTAMGVYSNILSERIAAFSVGA